MTGSDYAKLTQELSRDDSQQTSDQNLEMSISEEAAPMRRQSYADDTKSCESQTLLSRSFRAWTPDLLPEKRGVYVKRSVNVHRGTPGRARCRPGNKVKDGSILNVLAAQTLKIASMNGLGELDKLENELEDEINYENRSPAKTAFGRFRREGYHKLHSKMVLFIVVFLNVIDCLIVMAELILDFHNVSMKEEAKNDMLSNFMTLMMDKYNGSLGSLSKKTEESHVLLQHILNATVVFDYSYLPVNSTAELVTSCTSYLNKTQTTVVPNADQPSADQLGVCFGGVPYEKPFILEKDGRMSLSLIAVGHKLHYISIAILAVLVIVLGLKIVCSGKRFFKSRMQVFDGIIVLISFILDLVFIEGLSSLNTNEFVMILTFLLPWRIIRVLNSLIVAVLDKQRLNLKIIYTQKKKITRTLAEVNNKVEVLQRHVEVLQNLCSSRGIGDYEVKRALGGDSSSTLKNGSSGGLASMMALGKLAFQAADAFAPMTNGYKKPEISASEPVLNTLDISPPDTPRPGGDRASDNNNQAPKNTPVGIDMEPKVDTSEPYPEVTLEVPAENEKDIRLQTVTVHMNGSGPPKETSLNEDMRRSCSTTDLSDVQFYVNGNEIISKL